MSPVSPAESALRSEHAQYPAYAEYPEYAGQPEHAEGAPRRHRAHAIDAAPREPRATGAKGVLLPALIVLVIGSIFVGVYLAAFHAPQPHRLPVAVVGSSQTQGQVESALDAAQPGGFDVQGYPDPADARAALAHRAVYAAYITTGATPELLYAGANGTGVTATVTGAFGAVAKAGGQQLTARDVLSSSSGDTRGLSVFYAAFGVILAGFMFGTTTYQLAPRLEYRWRMLSLLIFGALGGVMVALVAGRAFHALPGPFAGIAGVVALMAIAAGGATMALIRLLGPAGVSLSSVVLLILGNASSGGILPADYLPGWLYPLHAILPVGVGVRTIQGLAYFGHDGLALGITVLSVWIVVCAVVLYLRDVWSVQARRS
ncbi:ABC transporter permease [Streptacidiphilus sp. MAP5-3]|uniref:ABC transporter permease n=1 Tax=unclassified Streptacidiphilus TaxID=2643834 RepID=UPI003517BA1C